MFTPENTRILVQESKEPILAFLQDQLTGLGYPVASCRFPDEAVALAGAREFDIALLAAEDPQATAKLILALRVHRPGLPVVALVPPERLAGAAGLIDLGADDYLPSPPTPAELRLRVARVLQVHDLDSALALLRHEIVRRSRDREIVVESDSMRSLLERARRIAPMRSTVLIFGESGTGKELVARAIHTSSTRRDHPFIAINCAAIPESLIESELFGHERGAFTGAFARMPGKFELAHRGTLFLDEVGEMNPSAQVKLLRVLEEQEFMRVGGSRTIRVDVRVIAATNADLERMVEEKRFRRDLYFRLKVVTLAIPPLRERREDIAPLVGLFAGQVARANNLRSRRVTPEALDALRSYSWPGNVRELQNLIENLLVSTGSEELGLEDLPPALLTIGPGGSAGLDVRAGMSLEEMERELIRRTLAQTRGNRTRTAKQLRIGVRTLQRKINRYALGDPKPRTAG